MSITMNSQAAREKDKKKSFVIRIITAVLGAVSALLFFFPYITIVFKDTTYVLTGFQLATVKGLRAVGPQMSGLISIPVVIRVCVILGALLAVAGVVLVLLDKAYAAGTCYILSGLMPLVVLLSTSGIQTAATSLNISKISMTFSWMAIYSLVIGILCAIFSLWTRGGEKLAESIFLVASCVSIGSVVMITVYVFASGTPVIAQIGLFNFLFGQEWNASKEIFGILPLLLSSIVGTIGAIIIGVPIGILTAVFLAETARPGIAKLVHPAVELLAGIPSVVYGFFGMLIIVPAIRDFPPFKGHTIGDSLLAAMIILAIMVLPTIVNVTETSLRAVPQHYREASLALGATPTRTIFKVTIPAAKSGILAGVILGVGRAIGETMAVAMVAGNVVNMPDLLGSVRFLTTGISTELSYSTGLHRQALFAIGLILFIFIMIVNISFTYISKKGVQMDAK